MKAAPLLRAWLRRLRQSGLVIHVRHRWCGWDEHKALRFETPQGSSSVRADAVILALGGSSWPKPRLGRRVGAGAWRALHFRRPVATGQLRV
jgi:predicted flavoprotein YhiN